MNWYHVQGNAYDDDADPFTIDEYVRADSEENAIKEAVKEVEWRICHNEEIPETYGWLDFFEDEPPFVTLSVSERYRYEPEIRAILGERDDLLKQVAALEAKVAELGFILQGFQPVPVPDNWEPEF